MKIKSNCDDFLVDADAAAAARVDALDLALDGCAKKRKEGRFIRVKARKGKISKGVHGLIVKKSIDEDKEIFIPKERSKRGKVTTFSRHSARRMKNKLMILPDNQGLYGITLTFKRGTINNPEDLRHWWNLFCCALRRSAKKCKISPLLYVLWRIELQKNGTPHFHLVLSTDVSSDIIAFRNLFFDYIIKRLRYCPPDNAFQVRSLNDSDEAYSYISSHSSKHKKSQLGWKGRQWGIFFADAEGKENFKVLTTGYKENASDNASYEVSEKQEVIIKRTLRKMYWAKMRQVLKNHREFLDFEVKNALNEFKDVKDFIRWKRKHPTPLVYSTKRAVKCRHSVRKLASRQALCSCQFMSNASSEKLINYIVDYERVFSNC